MCRSNSKKNKSFLSLNHQKHFFAKEKLTTTDSIIVALPLLISLLVWQNPCQAEQNQNETEINTANKTINKAKKLNDTKIVANNFTQTNSNKFSTKFKISKLDSTDDVDQDGPDEEDNNISPTTTKVEQKNNHTIKNQQKDTLATTKAVKKQKNLKKIDQQAEDIGELEFYGFFNRAFISVDDGYRRHNYFVDNAYANSNIGFKGEKELKKDLKFGGKLEILIAPASSAYVTQLDRSADNMTDINEADVWIENKEEKISLGYGGMASADAAAANLSGTEIIMSSDPSSLAGSMLFHQHGTENVTEDQYINPTYAATPSMSMQNRIRYDITKIKDWRFATSAGTASYTDANNVVNYNKYYIDAAAYYEKETKKYIINANLGLAKAPKNGDYRAEKYTNASFAILHKASGLNTAIAAGQYAWQILNEDDYPADDVYSYEKKMKSWYGLLGKQQQIFKCGKTNFAIDYYQSMNVDSDNDRSRAYGVGVVQNFDKLNTSLYLGVKKFKYSSVVESYDDIVIAFLGIKINFSAAIERAEAKAAGGIGAINIKGRAVNKDNSADSFKQDDNYSRKSVKRAVVRRR